MNQNSFVRCEVIHTSPETGVQHECGKQAAGYSTDGVVVCVDCEDDDTLKIVKRIGPCLDETKMNGYCDQWGGSDDPFDALMDLRNELSTNQKTNQAW